MEVNSKERVKGWRYLNPAVLSDLVNYMNALPSCKRDLSEVSGTELLKLLEFPVWEECLCYANEGTQGGPLQRFRIGATTWKMPPLLRGRDAGDCVQSHGQWLHQSYLCNEALIKTLDTEAQWSVLVSEHRNVTMTVIHPDSSRRGHRSSAFHPRPRPRCLCIGPVLLLCTFYNKTL